VLNRVVFCHSECSQSYWTTHVKLTCRWPVYALYMATIGDRLKFALDAKSDRSGTRYTASDLARACGVTRQAVSQWMRGQSTNIRPDNLVCVADWLGVEVRWLATGDGAMLKRDTLTLDQLTPSQRVTLQAVMDSFGKPPMKNDGTNNR